MFPFDNVIIWCPLIWQRKEEFSKRINSLLRPVYVYMLPKDSSSPFWPYARNSSRWPYTWNLPQTATKHLCSYKDSEYHAAQPCGATVKQPPNTAKLFKDLSLAYEDPNNNWFISDHFSLLRTLSPGHAGINFGIWSRILWFKDSLYKLTLTPLLTFFKSDSKLCHILFL